MSNSCVFCKIIAGEIPSTILYEDEDFKVILDIAPTNKGHAIVLPKKHVENIFEMDDDVASKLLVVVKKVSTAIKEELNCDGMNILQNNGEAAGQTVFHFHMHIIPRYENDNVTIKFSTTKKYGENEAAQLAKRIQNRL